MKTLKAIIVVWLFCCLLGCEPLMANDREKDDLASKSVVSTNITDHLEEVATPRVINNLNQKLKKYHPQVKITTPLQNATLNQTDITIKIAVADLPIFQDDKFKLGNHLNLIVDNEPLREIYNLDEPITVSNLAPGTHTVRVLAVTPWGESYKNRGAYAQTTFNVLAETNNNCPSLDLPLLTYSSPTGSYGAEPVLLDFYLYNPDLVLTENNPELRELRVKATVNGKSFTVENWQPYYLTGFAPGENWIQLELIDQSGNTIENTFNNTVRVFTYDPQQQDTLTRLVKNEVSLAEVRGIVEPSYYLQPVGTPEIIDFTEQDTSAEILPDESPDIPGQTSKVNSSPTASESEQKAPETGSEIDVLEVAPNAGLESQTGAVEAVVEPETSETNEMTKEQQPSPTIDSQVDSSAQVESKSIAPEIPPKIGSGKITITEPNIESDSDLNTTAEVDLPQPESVEIEGPDFAQTISTSEPEAPPENLETSNKPLWWRKILVKVRQTIEALAEKLPDDA